MLFKRTFNTHEAQSHAAEIWSRNRRIEAARLLENIRGGKEFDFSMVSRLTMTETSEIVGLASGKIKLEDVGFLTKRVMGLSNL